MNRRKRKQIYIREKNAVRNGAPVYIEFRFSPRIQRGSYFGTYVNWWIEKTMEKLSQRYRGIKFWNAGREIIETGTVYNVWRFKFLRENFPNWYYVTCDVVDNTVSITGRKISGPRFNMQNLPDTPASKIQKQLETGRFKC